VGLLLEDGMNGAVLLFGNQCNGVNYDSMDAAVKALAPRGMSAKQGTEYLLDYGFSFVLQKNPKDIAVLSRTKPIYAQADMADYAARYFGIGPDTKIEWKPTMEATGSTVPFEDIFVETSPKKEVEKTPEQQVDASVDALIAAGTVKPGLRNELKQRVLDKQREVGKGMTPEGISQLIKQEANKAQVKATGVAQQPAAQAQGTLAPDPKRERYVASLQGQPAMQSEPITFGIDATNVQSGSGVLVRGVVRGGTAAKSNVLAGDRIMQVGPFETGDATAGPWRIRNTADLKRAMSYMPPEVSIPVMLIRGGKRQDVHIRAKSMEPSRDNPNEYTIPQGEVQQMSKEMSDMQRDANDLQHLTLDEIAKYYNMSPAYVQKTLDKLGIRASDYVPNERDPVSMTGNQPANASALT
jgi:hypothetical protein